MTISEGITVPDDLAWECFRREGLLDGAVDVFAALQLSDADKAAVVAKHLPIIAAERQAELDKYVQGPVPKVVAQMTDSVAAVQAALTNVSKTVV